MKGWRAAIVVVVFVTLLTTAAGCGVESSIATPSLGTSVGEIREFPLPTGGTVEMAYIPAGSFLMGSEDGDDDERPLHQVYLDAYWIDRAEVTNDQFATFVADTGYATTAEDEGYGDEIPLVGGGFETHIADWQHPDGPDSTIVGLESYPVVWVSWNDALAFCTWRNARLPTEAEWEKAARGSDGRTYPWGENIDCGLTQFSSCADDVVEVGSFPEGASPYGVLDMAGNVSEWVADWEGSYRFSELPVENPAGPEFGDWKVTRGGSAYSTESRVRSAYRNSAFPFERHKAHGFRCAIGPSVRIAVPVADALETVPSATSPPIDAPARLLEDGPIWPFSLATLAFAAPTMTDVSSLHAMGAGSQSMTTRRSVRRPRPRSDSTRRARPGVSSPAGRIRKPRRA